jgi:glyoxylase-like metal-dependent hydrolase (beta-lactamase superfamily II)
MNELSKSIREQLYTLAPETAFYPGHGEPGEIGIEKSTNPYVRAE